MPKTTAGIFAKYTAPTGWRGDTNDGASTKEEDDVEKAAGQESQEAAA
jgi:hypothetical protein